MAQTTNGPARGTTPGRATKSRHRQVAAASPAHGSRDGEERATFVRAGCGTTSYWVVAE